MQDFCKTIPHTDKDIIIKFLVYKINFYNIQLNLKFYGAYIRK